MAKAEDAGLPSDGSSGWPTSCTGTSRPAALGAVTLVARNGRIAYHEAKGVMDFEDEEADGQGRHLPHQVDDEA